MVDITSEQTSVTISHPPSAETFVTTRTIAPPLPLALSTKSTEKPKRFTSRVNQR
jgi:hypothetical protein